MSTVQIFDQIHRLDRRLNVVSRVLIVDDKDLGLVEIIDDVQTSLRQIVCALAEVQP